MVARTKPPAAATPAIRFTSATRTAGGEPGRDGALRMAVLGALVALLVGTVAVLSTRALLRRSALDQLDIVRTTASQSIGDTLDALRRETGALADDPRTAHALRDLRDGFGRVADDLTGKSPGKLSAYDATLTRHYDGEVVPQLSAALGKPVSRETVYPSNDKSVVKDAPVILQSLYIANNRQPDADKHKLVDARDGSAYSRAHADAHPWFDALARRNGWDSVLLVDGETSHVVYSSAKTPDTFTALRTGPYRSSALAQVVQRASEPGAAGRVQVSDVERADAYGGRPMLFAAAPVLEGGSRIGVLAVALSGDRLESALVPGGAPDRFARLGLGDLGDVVLVGPDGKLRSAPRAFHTDPAAFWQSAAPDAPPASPSTSPVGLVAAPSAGVAEASASGEARGRFDGPSGKLLGSYGKAGGGAPWIVAAERPESDLRGPLKSLVAVLLLIIALAAGSGWVIGGRLWQQFGRRLHRATEGVQRALRGDRATRLDASQTGAVGDLAAAINRLLDERQLLLERGEEDSRRVAGEVDCLVGVVREATGGNLAPRAEVSEGALAGVSNALNEMLESIGALVSTLRTTTTRVGASADQIRTSAEQATRGAAAQAQECDATSASAGEVRSNTEHVAERCAGAIESARRTEQASRQGQSAIGDLLAGMDGLQRETRAATVKIKRLGERSMQISAIIGAISKMSAQTDMLALNAAIEASRAGEHGQGFTVVAEEVRKLAERAAAATKEIERLIAGIQADVNEAVSGMERQVERLDVQMAAAAEAQRALERVAAATGEASGAIQAIGEASDDQRKAAARLAEAVARLSEGAQNVQQSTDLARRSTGELLHAFAELDARASRFHA